MTDIAVVTMCVTVGLMALGQIIRANNYVSQAEFQQFGTRMDGNFAQIRKDIDDLGKKIT